MALALLRRRWHKSTSAAAAGLALPLPSGAGAVAREVVDPMGSPLAAADVTVTALDTHRVAARGTTDPYGYFLAALPPGRYSLLIAAEGLRPHRETIEIGADTSTPTERVWLQPAEALQLPTPEPGSSTRRTLRSASSPSTSAWPMSTAASNASRAVSGSPRT